MPVQVGVCWSVDCQVLASNVIDCLNKLGASKDLNRITLNSKGEHLIIHKKGAITVFKSGVCVEHSVVWFHYGRRDLGCWVDRERKLRLFWKVYLGRTNSYFVDQDFSPKAAPSKGRRTQSQFHLEQILSLSTFKSLRTVDSTPPNEWKTRKPCSPEHFPAILRI